MLNGACRDLLSVLPTKDRQQFDQELSHILSRKTTGQDSMLLLWCFGIVLLAEHAREAVRLQDSHMSFEECPATAPVERQWKTESGRRLFGSTTSLYKTINLAYLSVIWATKGDVGISDEEAVEGIRIAVRTLQCVDRAILRTWPKSSPSARNTFVKLPVKLSRANIDPTIQFEALCFYAMIAGDENLALEVVTRYERRLTNLASLVNAECLGETLLIALPVYSVSTFIHQRIMYLTISATYTAEYCSSNSCWSLERLHLAPRLPPLVELHNSSRANYDSLTKLCLTSGQYPFCCVI
jgi:hypothetical protein